MNRASHDDDSGILTGSCPLCGARAVIESPMLTPWFCSNDECDVLAWDPYSTLEQNLTNAAPVEVIHNQDNSDEMPNP